MIECPANCGRFFTTPAGCGSHLSTAQSCLWYRTYEKSAALEEVLQIEEQLLSEDRILLDQAEEELQTLGTKPGEDLQEFEEEHDIFHFIHLDEELAVGEQGPGPSTLSYRNQLLERQLGAKLRSLDDGESSSWIIEEHPSAGQLIRMDDSLRRRWMEAHNVNTNDPIDGGSASLAYVPFVSELDWKIAEWAVKDGIGHNSFDRLLAIPGVVEKLGLSYKNIAGMHKHIDSLRNKAGDWKVRHLRFKDRPDEGFVLRYRDLLEGIRSLWGDPSLTEHLVYKPKKIFQNLEKSKRVYSEMWDGKWWQITQNQLPEGATVAPLIIATDKTQLTQFSGSKQAYPVYLTLGNIPKALRRRPSQQACILIAYLPVEKISKEGLVKREHSGRYQRLFHDAMRHLFSPLVDASHFGVDMIGGDGAVRRVHPVLACYVADFPEQCLVTCCKYGTCPKCKVKAGELSHPNPAAARTPKWTLSVMENSRKNTMSDAQYFKACMGEQVNGYVYRPFWDSLPFTDIHSSITPDVLHQLYQGVLRHLITWCQEILGEPELDRRIRCLPSAYGVRHFKNGISALSQISGPERKNMAKILLSCLVGSDMPNDSVTAVRAILDFIYLAQYSTHDDDTLMYMVDSLKLWEVKKSSFIEIGVHEDLNIPKFHSLLHYVDSIRFFGATDNYNTEMFERLHIDFAKKGWRASNKKDEFPQMTKWLTRQENVETFRKELEWLQQQKQVLGEALNPRISSSDATTAPTNSSRILLPKHPSAPHRALTSIEKDHRIPFFSLHLAKYLAMLKPDSTKHTVHESITQPLPFQHLDVFYSFKFQLESLDDDDLQKDTVKASPLNGGRFDPVVVLTGDDAEAVSLRGTRIGRVKAIFTLPSKLQFIGSIKSPSPLWWPKTALAYVQWYTPPTLSPADSRTHNMTTVKVPPLIEGAPPWSIIPLSNIRQSCMLCPRFGKDASETKWTTDNVLDIASSFLVNNWTNIYTYRTLYKE